MQKRITTYRPGAQLPDLCFFILNKGMNAGRPSRTPNANCFVWGFESPEEMEFHYWLCWGLWQTKSFHINIIGSVIPFIRKDDFFSIVDLARMKVSGRSEKVMHAIAKLQKHTLQQQQVAEHLKQLHHLKRYEVRQMLS